MSTTAYAVTTHVAPLPATFPPPMSGSAWTPPRLPWGCWGHVYTHPDHRRHGLARRLATVLLAEVATRGGRYLIAMRQSSHWHPLAPDTYASAILLFNLVPGTGKFPVLGLDDGQRAELDLLEAMAAMEHGGPGVEVEICGGLPAAARVRAPGRELAYRALG